MITNWKEQMAHEPTRVYYKKLKEVIGIFVEEAHALSMYTEKQPRLEALEIGLDVGISTRCFLQFQPESINHLTSIDCGDVEGGVEFIESLKTGRWTFHHMRSDEYFAQCKKKFDIIYVDGDHSYEQTKKDINNAWNFLRGKGILIGHDILHKGNFLDNKDYGVTKAFREFIIEKNVDAHIYPPDPGLIVIKKP